jgi:diadenosine tetraphosphatase ApaH/serine/threonine PP2A family protein phosphatase
MSESLDLDAVLRHIETGAHLDEKCITLLLDKIIEVLYEEPTVLTLAAPITICGDIHGQLFDLFELLQIGGDPATTQYLFQGDYVDRGHYSLETYLYLVTLKLKYPSQIWLLRGNHECRQVSKQYGFYDECLQNYGHPGIWKLCQDSFDLLPMSSVVNGRIFATHGGLSPEIATIEQISLFPRQLDLPTYGELCDLAWSDPDDTVRGWGVSPRGAGWLFGIDPARQFCQVNKIELITRAHQLVMAGYLYNCQEKVLTVWSAPNYGYVSKNVASILRLDAELNRDLKIFKERAEQKAPDEFVPHYFT